MPKLKTPTASASGTAEFVGVAESTPASGQGEEVNTPELRSSMKVRKAKPQKGANQPSRHKRAIAVEAEALKPDFIAKASESASLNNWQPGDVGLNGGQVGYNAEGDVVEWIPNEERPDAECEPLLMRRNDRAIAEAFGEFDAKVFWMHHQQELYEIEARKLTLTEDQRRILKAAKRVARGIERKYGKRTLAGWDCHDWSTVRGIREALQWVLGARKSLAPFRKPASASRTNGKENGHE
jgi:hypothetical protein